MQNLIVTANSSACSQQAYICGLPCSIMTKGAENAQEPSVVHRKYQLVEKQYSAPVDDKKQRVYKVGARLFILLGDSFNYRLELEQTVKCGV